LSECKPKDRSLGQPCLDFDVDEHPGEHRTPLKGCVRVRSPYMGRIMFANVRVRQKCSLARATARRRAHAPANNKNVPQSVPQACETRAQSRPRATGSTPRLVGAENGVNIGNNAMDVCAKAPPRRTCWTKRWAQRAARAGSVRGASRPSQDDRPAGPVAHPARVRLVRHQLLQLRKIGKVRLLSQIAACYRK
jgi:hypothetical protein